jgi:hypothetical protein
MKTRAQKKKNKVNPTTPGKSPQLKSPPAIKTPGEDNDISVASVSSAASALGRGVALHIQKGLAIAVEEGGALVYSTSSLSTRNSVSFWTSIKKTNQKKRGSLGRGGIQSEGSCRGTSNAGGSTMQMESTLKRF